MTDPSRWQERIGLGFQVFGREGGEELGAGRDVCPDGRDELLVNVENGGDHRIPLAAVVDVHDEKVIVDVGRLPEALRRRLAGRRGRTTPRSRASDRRVRAAARGSCAGPAGRAWA